VSILARLNIRRQRQRYIAAARTQNIGAPDFYIVVHIIMQSKKQVLRRIFDFYPNHETRISYKLLIV
jgi:hypothetical protein